jgi:hypothetical protein
MGKTIAGVTLVKDAVKYDYCIEACVQSLAAFCDIVFIVAVKTDDGTIELLDNMVLPNYPPIVTLFQEESAWLAHEGRTKLSTFQNIGIEEAQKYGCDYVFLLQADECLHPDSISHIKRAVELDEEAFFVTRHNMWGGADTILNVPQSRKPCSSVVNRLTKSHWRSVEDGESIASSTASLDFINLIEIFHVGFIRNNVKHIAKIKEIQKNIFAMENYDSRADIKEEFDWKDWGFTEADLVPIPKPLPFYLNDWIAGLNK